MFNIIGLPADKGGWYAGRSPTKAEIAAAEKRWHARAERHIDREDCTPQCGGCAYFAALNGYWGLCINAASDFDGRAVFEHNGCGCHTWSPPESRKRKEG